MTRLTVLQVLPALDGGGVERGTLELACELVNRGHRSLVVSAGGRMVKELVDAGSKHIALPIGHKSLLTLRLIPILRRIIREENISILHARSRLPGWIAYLAWKGLEEKEKPRFITTVHGLYSVNVYSRIMTKGEKVIAVSDTVKDYILENYPGVDPGIIEVIHRGIDPGLYFPDYKPPDDWLRKWYSQYGELKNKFVVTLPGRITRLKGHEDFLVIIKALIEQGIPAHGLIVGDAHPKKMRYSEELVQKTSRFGIQDHITFTGHRDDLRNIMSTSSVVLSLSQKPESFGRTVLESLCLGTPVIGYNHGGASEIMAKLFPEGRIRVGDCVEAKEKLIEIYKTRPTPIKNNPYTLSSMLDKTIHLYEKMTGILLQ